MTALVVSYTLGPMKNKPTKPKSKLGPPRWVRLEEPLYQQARRLAAKQDRSFSNWARLLIIREVRGDGAVTE